MDIVPDNAREWTFTVHLILDPGGDLKGAAMVRVGDARLEGDHLMIDLAPGLAISGRLVLKLTD